MDFSLSSSLVGSAVSNPDKLALDLQFATDKTLTARKGPTPVFTRASSATFVGSNGLIQSAGTNVARFDHDPVTLACKGLLIEESRTNSVSRSEEFNDITWTPARLVSQPVSNTDISPSGQLTAEKLVPSLSMGDHRIDRAAVSGLLVGTVYTVSVFVKASGYTGFGINVGSSPSPIGATFDLATGTVASTQAGWTASIQVYPNGWYRCSTTFTFSAGTRLYLYVGSTGTNFSYVGDETSGILIWGAQLEAGAFATSYIPTTTASVIRSFDVCSITGSAFSGPNGFYNNAAGTLLSEVSIANLVGNNRGIVQIDDNSNLNILRHVYSSADGGFRSIIRSNSDTPTTFSSTTGTASTIQKRVIAYEGTSFASTTNGAAVATATRAMPIGLNGMKIGNLADGPFYLNGTIAAIRYYKKRLANAKLQTITV